MVSLGHNEFSSYIDKLAQKRRNSSALAMELRVSFAKPSVCKAMYLCVCYGHKGW